MTKQELQITQEDVITTLIYRAEWHAQRNKISPSAGLKSCLHFAYYPMEKNWTEKPVECTYDFFIDIFCKAFLNVNFEVPTDYLYWLCCSLGSDGRIDVPDQRDEEYYNLIKLELEAQHAEKRRIYSVTDDIMSKLLHQSFENKYKDSILDLVERHKFDKMGNYLTFINLFNYGYIMGKRAERAKLAKKSI